VQILKGKGVDMFLPTSYSRPAWYAIYTSLEFFEYNPFVNVHQATANLCNDRKPLYSVYRSDGRIVVSKNQKLVTSNYFSTFDDAFIFVESLLTQVDLFSDFQSPRTITSGLLYHGVTNHD
jgi:hypothetical protein